VKTCHYNLLLVRLLLDDNEVELLRVVGCHMFLRKYDEDTPDQRELYEVMGAKAYTDPLVVELDYEEEGEEEG
jgi:hypothetical protein